MAYGLPVAAYPVTGPIDVIEDRRAGCIDEDLRTACMNALQLRREDVAQYAKRFSWTAATEQFVSHLHPRRASVEHTTNAARTSAGRGLTLDGFTYESALSSMLERGVWNRRV